MQLLLIFLLLIHLEFLMLTGENLLYPVDYKAPLKTKMHYNRECTLGRQLASFVSHKRTRQ